MKLDVTSIVIGCRSAHPRKGCPARREHSRFGWAARSCEENQPPATSIWSGQDIIAQIKSGSNLQADAGRKEAARGIEKLCLEIERINHEDDDQGIQRYSAATNANA
jgi:hypothetical protein